MFFHVIPLFIFPPKKKKVPSHRGGFLFLYFSPMENNYIVCFLQIFHILYPFGNDTIANVTGCGIISMQNHLSFFSLRYLYNNEHIVRQKILYYNLIFFWEKLRFGRI